MVDGTTCDNIVDVDLHDLCLQNVASSIPTRWVFFESLGVMGKIALFFVMIAAVVAVILVAYALASNTARALRQK